MVSDFLTFHFYRSLNTLGRNLSGRMNNAWASACFGYCMVVLMLSKCEYQLHPKHCSVL